MSERELLKRAHKLLDDLVTGRPMERYDVQKWLEDASSVLDKENVIFNVVDYGADPSGKRDSLDAIQAAVDAAAQSERWKVSRWEE